MWDHIKQTMGWAIVFFIVAIPAMAPELFVGISVVGWGITYLYLLFASIGADQTNTLPWMVADPDRFTWFFLILALGVGMLNGIRGMFGMAFFYAPLIFLPGFMVAIGLGVENKYGWDGHIRDNYYDAACEMGADGLRLHKGLRDDCVHQPKPGTPYPIYITDSTGDVVSVRSTR